MGKRGPRPTPTNLRLLSGETRPSRLNADEAAPPEGKVTCPADLSAEARKVWRRLAPSLIQRGLLTVWDRESFAVFCEAVVTWRRASDMMGKAILVTGLHGGLVKNPAHQVARDSAAVIRAFAQEFGLTPSARSAIKVGLGADDDDLAGILSRSG